ncbi:melanoma antigen preferentially expressed in tumors-like [Sorex araneus]|uniref:melanoma antigen preferentially expressed in tumors-like n=1 Tax=Sorex araneus TaxID=42254 RepID=UPI002433E0C4|nr:melanoma antigen preferentially expressed in tumors-like [Sorex araneus]
MKAISREDGAEPIRRLYYALKTGQGEEPSWEALSPSPFLPNSRPFLCLLPLSKAKEMERFPVQLQDLAIHQLLRDKTSIKQTLNELPITFFPILLDEAIKGKHKKYLRALVQVWPFTCLNLGSFNWGSPENQDCLRAILEGLDTPLTLHAGTRRPKLRMVDFRPDSEQNDGSQDAAGCVESSATWKDTKAAFTANKPRQRRAHWLPWECVDLYLNLSTCDHYSQIIFSCIQRRMKISCRPLRLFVRKLCIRNKSCEWLENALMFMQLEFIEELELDIPPGFHSEGINVTRKVKEMTNLRSISLSVLRIQSHGQWDQVLSSLFSFLFHAKVLSHLRAFHLSSYYISGHVYYLFRYLPATLEILELPYCNLEPRDISCLSQSPQASSLKKLNLRNTCLSRVAPDVLKALLQSSMATLQELDLGGCRLEDVTFMALLPLLSQCVHLQELRLFDSVITMATLRSLLQHLAGLSKLQCVVLPVPEECFEGLPVHGRTQDLRPQLLRSVKAMAEEMLCVPGRKDVRFTYRLSEITLWKLTSESRMYFQSLFPHPGP